MNKMNNIYRIFLVSLVVGVSTCAQSHGDGVHARTVSPVRPEQKDWGIAGDELSVRRTVTLSMDDNMRFTPSLLSFQQGETVRFVIRNKGKMLHELVIGTRKELDQHAAMMLKFPTMEHDEPYMAHVASGQKGELVWTFNRTGEFDFACLIAGHYQAGMLGKIRVTAAVP